MKMFLKVFEKYIIISLLIMMVVVVFVGTIRLGLLLFNELLNPPFFLIEIDKILEIFGYFLIILIGLELIEATKVYLLQQAVHVEVIFLIAIIAITRKVIILDLNMYSASTLLGIAAIILSLSVGYYLLKKVLD